MKYETVQVRFEETTCFLKLHRPDAGNTINERLVRECREVLDQCEETAKIVVLEGSPEVFCMGADFSDVHGGANGEAEEYNPEPLYAVWKKLATGPFVTISHVRGKVNAGGMGFLGASDIVLADAKAQFSLSEMLFGLFPACVLPFLIRRIGFQKAHYMALTTQPVSVQEAHEWGLVDAWEARSEALLRRHLLRLGPLSRKAITRYKLYVNSLDNSLERMESRALDENRRMFADPDNLKGIYRYVEDGIFPWEG